MSRLNELIQKLCPNGVDCYPIKELADVGTGSSNGNEAVDDGKYPFFIRSQSVKRKNNYEYNEEAIIIPGEGGIGEIYHYINGKYALHQRVYRIHFTKNVVDTKYAYHYFSANFKNFIMKKAVSATVKSIRKPMIQEFMLPVPPLEVQREIVRILDSFTLLTAELTAELTARKKQYEFYRDELLKFDNESDELIQKLCPDGVEYMPLEDIIYSLNTGLNPRQFFKLNTDDATNYYVTIREIHNNRIEFNDSTDRINDEALKLCNKRSNLEIGDVLFSGTGTIGETALIEQKPSNWNIKEGVYVIKPIQEKILSRFLMYLLQSTYVRTTYMKKVAGGTVKSIPMKELRKVKLPVPPLEVQREIVRILDSFTSLTTDLSSGLPAEIEARQKQYEYYRDKLLNFKKLEK